MEHLIKPIKILLLTVITICYGCASNPYIAKSDISLSENPNEGLAIVTVNTEGAPKGFHYVIQSVASGTRIAIPEYGHKDKLLPMLISDFEDIKGKLVVLKLPEGKYKFTEWFHTSYDQYIGRYETTSVQDFPIYFDVVNNKATYIGELYQTNSYYSQTRDSKITIADSNERDIKLFLKKYPQVSSDDVVIKIAKKAEHIIPK